jgi:CheY-like chemotaxis protein
MPTVLIVEDHSHTRRLLAKVFAERGWAVLEAGTVAEGLAALDSAPDCAVIDLSLPDGDGIEVLRKARSGASGRVAVVVTAVSDPARLSQAAALKPHLMIQKPFDWEILWRYCQSELGEAG